MPPTAAVPESTRASTPLTDLRRDMAVWAEPVIADCIWDSYRHRGLGPEARGTVAVHHRRLWRALILQKPDLAEEIRGELHGGLARAGLPAAVAAEIDNDVMEELMDVVFARFRGSRDAAKGCSLVLLAAASHIGAARPLAA